MIHVIKNIQKNKKLQYKLNKGVNKRQRKELGKFFKESGN